MMESQRWFGSSQELLQRRPQIAVPHQERPPRLRIDLYGYFGLHPASRLQPIYDEGHLAIVTRSDAPTNTRRL